MLNEMVTEIVLMMYVDDGFALDIVVLAWSELASLKNHAA